MATKGCSDCALMAGAGQACIANFASRRRPYSCRIDAYSAVDRSLSSLGTGGHNRANSNGPLQVVFQLRGERDDAVFVPHRVPLPEHRRLVSAQGWNCVFRCSRAEPLRGPVMQPHCRPSMAPFVGFQSRKQASALHSMRKFLLLTWLQVGQQESVQSSLVRTCTQTDLEHPRFVT